METKNWLKQEYDIGFALSGGFIKGFAHLGAIQALYEHGIRPDIISGVSAGALAGVFIADGCEPYKVLDHFSGYTFNDLTTMVIPTSGFYELKEFIAFLKGHLKAKRFEELQIPLLVTATDFDHGKSVHFHRGSLAERIAASCCMPVMFKPLRINGVHYVDGGLLMNLPVSPLRKQCEKIVAINVSPLIKDKYKNNILSIATRSYRYMFRANTFNDRNICDLLIEPYNLDGYSNRELNKAEEIFEQGYSTANKVLENLSLEKGNIWKD